MTQLPRTTTFAQLLPILGIQFPLTTTFAQLLEMLPPKYGGMLGDEMG